MKEDRLSLEEFEARFQTEEDCADYLYQVKWPQGFICPRCGHNHAYPLTHVDFLSLNVLTVIIKPL